MKISPFRPKKETATPASPIRTAFKWSVRFLLAFVVLVGALMAVVAFDLPPTQAIENPQNELSTQLISADGVVLQRFYSRENRTNVTLNEISPYVVDALIATEDARYYDHSGIDPKSFFAILKSMLTGGGMRGGSTIPMQLARNLYDEVGENNKYIRKVKEYLVSVYFERKFTKTEILEAYLNTVNIYGNSYGIETTARRLFDKSAKDLKVEEAALIVGMLKGQGVYNPFRHPERTLNRRNTILDQMAKYGTLGTRFNLDSLQRIPLAKSLVLQEEEHVKGLAPYFREHLRDELLEWCDNHRKPNGSKYNLYTDGLRVYTTIDSRMQAYAEAAVRQHLTALQKDFDKTMNFGKNILDKDPTLVADLMRLSERYQNGKRAGKSDAEIEKEFRERIPMKVFSWSGPKDTTMTPLDSLRYFARFLETGVVSIDPTNGHVKAWVGGPDFRFFKYDHVAQGKRQVGSTFKPFVYATLFENNPERTPCDRVLNQPIFFDLPDGKRWSPKNSGAEIGGFTTLRRGLSQSYNLVTAKLMSEVGPEAVTRTAYKMGIKSKLDPVPSLCLGTTDLSVLELTSGYATFANMGVFVEPLTIIRIEDASGNVLEEFAPESRTALDPSTAYLMVDMLKSVVDQGTATRLRSKYGLRQEIGGKTGTTQNHSDGWFVGITPNLVTGVWVGHADRRMRFSSITYGQGANMALPIWALFMKGVFEDTRIALPNVPFRRPEPFTRELNCTEIPAGPVTPEPEGADL